MNIKAWFLVAGLIVGRTAGKLSCEDCTRIGNLVSDEIIRPENIQAELALVEDAVCAAIIDQAECKFLLGVIYNALAPVLFGSEFGWFSPTWMCMEECGIESTALPRNLCQDCEDKLVARNSAMADEASILTVLDALQAHNWCVTQFPDNEADCQKYIDLIIPAAFPIWAADNSWEPLFCEAFLGC